MTASVDAVDAAVIETANKNLDLACKFGLAIIADPSMLDDIPNGSQLVLLPDDDPALVETNIESGFKAVRAGRDVYFRRVRVADFPPVPELPEAAKVWLAQQRDPEDLA